MYSTNINLQSLLSKHLQSDTKTCNLLEINESLDETFIFHPTAVFRENKNLKELIGSNKIEKNKVKKRPIQKTKPRKSSSCLTNLRSLCCKQVRKITTLKRQQTKTYLRYFTTSTVPAATSCDYVFHGVHFM